MYGTAYRAVRFGGGLPLYYAVNSTCTVRVHFEVHWWTAIGSGKVRIHTFAFENVLNVEEIRNETTPRIVARTVTLGIKVPYFQVCVYLQKQCHSINVLTTTNIVVTLPTLRNMLKCELNINNLKYIHFCKSYALLLIKTGGVCTSDHSGNVSYNPVVLISRA